MNACADQCPPAIQPSENIFLVGLMGAGKTSVGKMLAKRLNKAFCDSDQEIERTTGVRIPVIFEIEGEDGFRLRECKMLAELVRRKNIVLATGGGAILSAHNRKLLAAHGTVIYLHAAINDLWRRTRYDKSRPLLQTDDPLGKLQELLTQRDPLYREIANLIIDTGNQSLGSLAHKIEQQLAQLRSNINRTADESQRAN
ncbi:MAG: shikimate kinase [Pseudomonadota bacterium]